MTNSSMVSVEVEGQTLILKIFFDTEQLAKDSAETLKTLLLEKGHANVRIAGEIVGDLN
jgi:DNA-binding protein YbaB